jgi:hypothetical protein
MYSSDFTCILPCPIAQQLSQDTPLREKAALFRNAMIQHFLEAVHIGRQGQDARVLCRVGHRLYIQPQFYAFFALTPLASLRHFLICTLSLWIWRSLTGCVLLFCSGGNVVLDVGPFFTYPLLPFSGMQLGRKSKAGCTDCSVGLHVLIPRNLSVLSSTKIIS